MEPIVPATCRGAPRTPGQCPERGEPLRRPRERRPRATTSGCPRRRSSADTVPLRRPASGAPGPLRAGVPGAARSKHGVRCRCRCAARVPGVAPVGCAVDDDDHAVDEHPLDAVRAGGQARRVAGQVGDERGVVGTDGRRGRTPRRRRSRPRAARPGRGGRTATPARCVISCTACSTRNQLAAAEAVGEEARRVGRAAHAVEVGAGVGAADHRPRVVPQRRRRMLPATGPSSSCGIGHSTVRSSSAITMSSSVPNARAPALGGDVAHDPAAAAPRSRGRTCRR